MDYKQMLIRKTFRDLGLTLPTTNNPKQVVSYRLLRTFLIAKFTVEFLHKEDPPHKSKLSILLREKVLESRVMCVHNHETQSGMHEPFLKQI